MSRKIESTVPGDFRTGPFRILFLALLWTPLAFTVVKEQFVKPWADEIERAGKQVPWQEALNREQKGMFAYIGIVLLILLIAWSSMQLRRYLAYRQDAAEREKNLYMQLSIQEKKK